ncbi:PEP-CTERM sorting domain-containing protein [Desulfuromonas sp. TF]|uniref:PEP-CTERM sorting domain-containing protein n=1 Tax=Desulfuromonas sp. TF TaxID=1232410 RepID=UPI0004864716|nr:PEP-CTERM sorting domain-containing protein [Desulfuromonas sp. TF]
MKKVLLLLPVLLFSISNFVCATPVYFETDLAGSAVTLSGTTSSGWPGTATLTATLSPSLASESFTLAEGESYSFDFFEFNLDLDGFVLAGGGDFTVEATLGFITPDDADTTGNGNGLWGTVLGVISGGYLTWTDIPRTFTLLDGNELTIDFESGVDIFCGTNTTIQATVTNNGGAPAPVPEPSTMILLGAGLIGLGAYRKLQKV